MSRHTADNTRETYKRTCPILSSETSTLINGTKHARLTASHGCVDGDEHTYKSCLESGLWNLSLPLCK